VPTTTWEYDLEPLRGNPSLTDIRTKFTIRGDKGWEYAGSLGLPDGTGFLVWKRPKKSKSKKVLEGDGTPK
jgi:hypothetical protein